LVQLGLFTSVDEFRVNVDDIRRDDKLSVDELTWNHEQEASRKGWLAWNSNSKKTRNSREKERVAI